MHAAFIGRTKLARAVFQCWVSSCLLFSLSLFAQGDLTPPGPPTNTFKTLLQVEPRTDVQKLPGDGTSQFIINQPGSYHLTTNIVGTNGKHGISIRANGVTLDLNGFALLGIAGSLDGINILGTRRELEIRSGSFEGWGGDGLDAASSTSESRYFNLRAEYNGGYGLSVGPRAVVTECQAASNRLSGIRVAGGLIKNCVVTANGFTNGFPNGEHGILVWGSGGQDDGHVVKDCISTFNSGDGIRIISGVPGATATVSGNASKWNGSDGIHVDYHCIVRDNICVTNAVSGIHVSGTGNRIEDNHVAWHATGVLCDPAAVGNLIIKNSAQGNAVGYVVPVGNNLGVIMIAPGLGFVGASPWGNFEY